MINERIKHTKSTEDEKEVVKGNLKASWLNLKKKKIKGEGC